MTWVLSFLPFFIRTRPRVALIAALGVSSILLALGAYVKGRIDQDHANTLASLKATIAGYERALKVDEEVSRRNAKLRASYRQRTETLEAHIQNMPDSRAECLAPSDVDSLRKLWLQSK